MKHPLLVTIPSKRYCINCLEIISVKYYIKNISIYLEYKHKNRCIYELQLDVNFLIQIKFD
jgi:hypothetical protein